MNLNLAKCKFRLKFHFKQKQFIRIFLLIMATPAMAGNIFTADNYFLQKQYDLANKEYLAAAEIGNPRASYQLGIMHYQGLGTKPNNVKALIWFSLAAEHNYDNSVAVVKKLLASMPVQQKNKVIAQVSSFQQSFGKQSSQSKYYPQLLTQKLTQKIHFGDYKENHQLDSFIDEDFDSQLSFSDSADEDNFDDGLGDDDDIDSSDGFEGVSPASQLTRLQDGPYLLIADYDIGPDGSIRNIMPIQTIGMPKDALYNLSITTLPKPKFINNGVHFVNRAYLGMASFDKFEIRDEHPKLYSYIRRKAVQFSKSDLPQDIYKHAMMLMTFPWLTQEDGDVDKLLKSAAEQGHALAKFEYGLKLYREQKDITQAIYWISQATKQGNSQAQYRLARILLDSPWVVNDDKKALFWLAKASKQNHLPAKLMLAEVKLLAKDENLHDVDNALLYLNELSDKQQNNPQYHYLQAIAHVKVEPRQLSQAVISMREAIALGEDYNWNVTPWQQQLTKWTSGGSVTIQEL